MPVPTLTPFPASSLFPGVTLYPGSFLIPGYTALGSSTSVTLQGAQTVFFNVIDPNGVKWVLKAFDGWGSPRSTLNVVQKPRQNGGWGGLSYQQPRYIHATVSLYAPTDSALTVALDSLYAAVSLDDALLTVQEAGFTRSTAVRRSDEVLHTRVTNRVAEVSFQMVAVDPRKMGQNTTASTLLPITTGGITVPFTVPFTITSTVLSGQINLTNPGNTTGPVAVRIDGPCTGPVITHTSSTTTNALVFSSNLSMGTGEFLIVNMDARTALANGQTTRAGYITSRGWSGFDPGSNTWSFTASSYDPAAQITVTAAAAWL